MLKNTRDILVKFKTKYIGYINIRFLLLKYLLNIFGKYIIMKK